MITSKRKQDKETKMTKQNKNDPDTHSLCDLIEPQSYLFTYFWPSLNIHPVLLLSSEEYWYDMSDTAGNRKSSA
jgi:hypothetical protein